MGQQSQIELEIVKLEQELKLEEESLTLAESRSRLHATRITALREEIRKLKARLNAASIGNAASPIEWVTPTYFEEFTWGKRDIIGAVVKYLRDKQTATGTAKLEAEVLPALLRGGLDPSPGNNMSDKIRILRGTVRKHAKRGDLVHYEPPDQNYATRRRAKNTTEELRLPQCGDIVTLANK